MATPPASPATGIGMPVRGVARGPGPCPLSSSRCAADRAVSSRRRGSAGLALGRAGSRGGLLEGRVGPGGASVGAVATKISVQATALSSRGSLPLSATYPAAFAATLTFYEN